MQALAHELGSHCFTIEERIAAPQADVFAVLTDVRRMVETYSPGVTSVQALTKGPFGVGTQWIEARRYLFLREVISVRVTEHEAPQQYAALLDDGCNTVHYNFQLQAEGENETLVQCTVRCYMRLEVEVSNPSERLARMLERHERPLLQRLKGYVERNISRSHSDTALPVC